MHDWYMTNTKKAASKRRPNNLKALRRREGWTADDVAEKVGSTQPTISRIENSIQTPEDDLLDKLLKLFNCTETQFFDPIFRRACTTVTLVPLWEEKQIVEWKTGPPDPSNALSFVPTGIVKSADSFAVEMKDDALSPTIKEGDVVFIDPGGTLETGCFVLAVKDGKEALIRQYGPGRVNDKGEEYYELLPEKNKFPVERSDRRDLKIIGRVVGLQDTSFQ
jgi:transcriptional regulator with XRE-family HTH domain